MARETIITIMNIHPKTALISGIVIAIIFGASWGIYSIQQELHSAQVDEYINRSRTATSEERYVDAFNLMSEARSLAPTDLDLIVEQGDIAFLNGDYEVAQQLYLEASQTISGEQYFIRALQEISKGNLQDSLILLEKARETIEEKKPLTSTQVSSLQSKVNEMIAETNNPKKQALAAKALIEERAFTLAIDVLTTLLTQESNYRDAYYLRSIAQYRLGQNGQALEDVEQALSIDPNYKPARELLETIEN